MESIGALVEKSVVFANKDESDILRCEVSRRFAVAVLSGRVGGGSVYLGGLADRGGHVTQQRGRHCNVYDFSNY